MAFSDLFVCLMLIKLYVVGQGLLKVIPVMNIIFVPFIQLVFKKLYKNSTRATGTLRYFREKLQRRNATVDVKHFED